MCAYIYEREGGTERAACGKGYALMALEKLAGRLAS